MHTFTLAYQLPETIRTRDDLLMKLQAVGCGDVAIYNGPPGDYLLAFTRNNGDADTVVRQIAQKVQAAIPDAILVAALPIPVWQMRILGDQK